MRVSFYQKFSTDPNDHDTPVDAGDWIDLLSCPIGEPVLNPACPIKNCDRFFAHLTTGLPMIECAYCGAICKPTREHVVPRWYNDTPGEAETFSARAPVTHLRGDLIVKDVCSGCNSGPLAALDAYGKELYEQYFERVVYAGETVDFDCDGERLLRWLLKLSYNSARAQNADAQLLRELRQVILGTSEFSGRIRCWVHLVAASYVDSESNLFRPARREERDYPDTWEPRWFRLGQFRLPASPAFTLVQRSVLINSFAFTLLIAPDNLAWPCQEFDEWIELFTQSYPSAHPLLPMPAQLKMASCGDHAAVSLYFLLTNYPTRFGEPQNPWVIKLLKDEIPLVMVPVPRELIEKSDPEPVVAILQDMVSSRENAMAFRQRVGISVEGFDADPRALWQIPEARMFFRQLFEQCPFSMLLAHPDGALLKLLAACWIYEPDLSEDAEGQRTADFLQRAFHGLNHLTHRLALSRELNEEICKAGARALFGDQSQGPF